jgi:hypothetical protein
MLLSKKLFSKFWNQVLILYSFQKVCIDMILRLDSFYTTDTFSFGCFHITGSMMIGSIPILRERILSMMDFWRIPPLTITDELVFPFNQEIFDHLFHDINIYGLYLGSKLIYDWPLINTAILRSKQQIMKLSHWEPIISYDNGYDLCMHELLPDPSHFIQKKKIQSYLDAAKFVYTLNNELIKDESYVINSKKKRFDSLSTAPEKSEPNFEIQFSCSNHKNRTRTPKYRGLKRRIKHRKFEMSKKDRCNRNYKKIGYQSI